MGPKGFIIHSKGSKIRPKLVLEAIFGAHLILAPRANKTPKSSFVLPSSPPFWSQDGWRPKPTQNRSEVD
eukprot:9537697-Karenia_brevis.AAC.1